MPDYSIQAFHAFGFRLSSIFPGPDTKMIPEKLKQRFMNNGSNNNNDRSFHNYNESTLQTIQTTQL